MKLVVNGVDMLPYLDGGGYKVTREDGDSPDAGRTMDYTMHRARIATKFRIDATFKMLYTADAEIVLPALLPEMDASALTAALTRTSFAAAAGYEAGADDVAGN